jgi:DNA repair protein SbcC/Rad50
MKITLHNIRCYNNASFEFPDKGLCLLKGETGIGKSSLLDAIYWVLYGKTLPSLYSHGTKQTFVIFEHRGWKITRKRGKNKISLIDENNKEYIEEVAQKIINQRYGERFDLSSYIRQVDRKGHTSFLYMNPQSQQIFLERLAFDESAENILTKAKSRVLNLKKNLIEKSTRRSTLEEEFTKILKPDVIECPNNWSSNKHESEKKKTNVYLTKVENYNKEISKLKPLLAVQLEKEKQRNQLNQKITSLQNELNEVTILLENLPTYSLENLREQYKTLQKNISEVQQKENKLNEITNLINFNNKQEKLRKSLEEKINILNDSIKTITNQLENLPQLNKTDIQEQITYLEHQEKLQVLKEDLLKETKLWEITEETERKQLLSEITELETIPQIPNQISELDKQVSLHQQKIRLEITIKKINEQLSDCDPEEDFTTAISEHEEAITTTQSELIKAKNAIKIYPCPHCRKPLRWENEPIVAEEFTEKLDIKNLENRLSQLRKDNQTCIKGLAEIKSLKTQLQNANMTLQVINAPETDPSSLLEANKIQVNEQAQRIKKIETLKRKLKNEEWSATAIAQKNRLVLKEKQVNLLKQNKTECKTDLQTLKTLLNEANLNEQKKINITSELVREKTRRNELLKDLPELQTGLEEKQTKLVETIEKLNEEIKTLQPITESLQLAETIEIQRQKYLLIIKNLLNQIKEYNSQVEILGNIDLNLPNKVKLTEIKLENYIQKYKEAETSLKNCLNYKKYLEESTRYKELEYRTDTSIIEEKYTSNKLQIADRLVTKIKHCQSVSITELIDTLNENLPFYLEKFFRDDIQVIISPFKETSSGTKDNMSVKVIYKGDETDLGGISGGEQTRIDIAFALALNSLVDSRLLFFDESLNHLNGEIVEKITEVLKAESNINDKLIICILHQVSEELFDTVIDLG